MRILELTHYNYKKRLQDINLNINGSDIVSIIGRTGSGKSTLLQMIFDTINNNDIAIIYDNPTFSHQINYNFCRKVNNLYDFSIYKSKLISDLSLKDKYIIKIAIALDSQCKVLLIDTAFDILDKNLIEKIIKYCIVNRITLLYTTTNDEILGLSKSFILMNNCRIIANDSTKDIEDYEILLKKNGYNMPFIKELNSLLKSYNLINSEIKTIKGVIESLWK